MGTLLRRGTVPAQKLRHRQEFIIAGDHFLHCLDCPVDAGVVQIVEQDDFLEYDHHADNGYGTPRAQLEEKLVDSHVILDIEPKGAKIVHEKRPDATLIFIMPPSMEELERRLRGRGDTSEEQIAMRLERAKWEMEQRGWYDYVVVNDQVNRCVEEILNIIAEKAD